MLLAVIVPVFLLARSGERPQNYDACVMRSLQALTRLPDRGNGFLDYVRAAMIVDRPGTQRLLRYVSARLFPSLDAKDMPARPADVPEGASLAELQKLEESALAPAFDLIRSGNAKACYYPSSDISMLTLYPEGSSWIQILKGLARSIDAEFVAGDSKRATENALLGLTFSRKLRVNILMLNFMGMRGEAIVLEPVRKHLGQLKRPDAAKLDAWARSALASTAPLVATARQERRACRRSFFDVLANPAQVGDAALTASAKRITQKRGEQLYNDLFSDLERPMAAVEVRLKRPENTWLTPLGVPRFSLLNKFPKDVSKDDLAFAFSFLRIYAALTTGQAADNSDEPPGAQNDGEEEAYGFLHRAEEDRLEDRLLVGCCEIVKYREAHQRLPRSLADVPSIPALDTGTLRPYSYVPGLGGNFEFACRVPTFGNIHIGRVTDRELVK